MYVRYVFKERIEFNLKKTLAYPFLRVHVRENRVFFSSKIFFCFSASVIAFACKSWHLSPKISSFEMYSSELWPICRFWLFLTTFVLLVLERSVLMPEQS